MCVLVLRLKRERKRRVLFTLLQVIVHRQQLIPNPDLINDWRQFPFFILALEHILVPLDIPLCSRMIWRDSCEFLGHRQCSSDVALLIERVGQIFEDFFLLNRSGVFVFELEIGTILYI